MSTEDRTRQANPDGKPLSLEGGSRKRGTARRVPMNPFHLIMLVRPHLLRPTSRCRDWVARNRDRDRDRDRDRNRNFDFDPDLGFYDTLTGRGVGEGVIDRQNSHLLWLTLQNWLEIFVSDPLMLNVSSGHDSALTVFAA